MARRSRSPSRTASSRSRAGCIREKGRKKATELTKKVKGVVNVDNQLKLFSDK